jgi:hypothetical protein
MAVPTITSVTPSTVWTGGQLVVVRGTGFRLPPEPPVSTAGPLPDPLPTVGVLVGGVAAAAVQVLSETMLSCKLPAADPTPAPVPLVVRNLDDTGQPIAGESATMAEAVTYARPDLSVEEDGGRVERALIRLLKRQVLANVVNLGTGPDFGEAPFTVTEVAAPPGLLLTGPRVREDRPHWNRQRGAVTSPSVTGAGVDIRRRPDVVSLEYTIGGYARSGAQATSLLFIARKVLGENAFLEVQRAPDDPAKGTIKYQMIVPLEAEIRDTSTPNKDGMHSFDGLVVAIHGVALEDITCFQSQAIERVGIGTQKGELLGTLAKG